MFDFGHKYNQISAHGIHSYPAKFPASVPKQIIDHHLTGKGKVILDPFSGCGTTLLEGLLNGHNVVGNDINYIGNLIADVKTSIYKKNEIKSAETHLKKIISTKIINKSSRNIDFHNKNHWFQSNVQNEICLLLDLIDQERSPKLKNLYKVSLSEIIIKVSNQESDTRYEAIEKDIKDYRTIELYAEKLEKNIKKVTESSNLLNPKLNKTIFNQDARNLSNIKSDSIDLTVTSPPYANTYDYYLYHKHRMNWLGYDFNHSKSYEIGSRLQFSSKKDDISVWENDILVFLNEFKRVSKNNSVICVVIGDSVVNKSLFEADKCVMKLSKQIKLSHIYTKSISLSKNTKKFNNKWRSKLDKKEHVIVLKVHK